MTYVRGHYRRDGSYVRPHHRRTRPRTVVRTATYSRPVAVSPSTPSGLTGPTTRVRGHYRNGVFVRAHDRRLASGVAVAAVGGGSGLLILLVVLAALSVRGGGAIPGPGSRPTPTQSATAPVHLPR